MARKKTLKKNNKEEIEEQGEKERPSRILPGDVKRSIVAVILFALALIMVLGFFGKAGLFGEFLNKATGMAVGVIRFIFPIFLIGGGIILLFRKETFFYVTKLVGLFITLLSFVGFFHWFFDPEKILKEAAAGHGGGYLGFAMNYVLGEYVGSAGSLVAILALFFLGVILVFNFSLAHFFLRFKKKEEAEGDEDNEGEEEERKASPEEDRGISGEAVLPVSSEKNETVPEISPEDQKIEENIGKIEFVDGRDHFVAPGLAASNERVSQEKLGRKKIADIENEESVNEGEDEAKYIKPKKNSRWILPAADLLEKSFGEAKGGDVEKNFAIIEKTLKDFGIDVERGTAKTGPAVTQYSFRPAIGVKISKILSLQNDLALALAAHPIRIEAPIPGQSLIGIEIPNKSSMVVRLRNMLEDSNFKRRSSNLTLALGEDVSGECIYGDITKMPHLMIAGATGTGKSVCINTIITTLLYQNSPEELKFIMVDPKRVELSLYNGIPHLLTDVIVENSKVVNTLKWAVSEMERRYRLLQDTGSRDIGSYREKLNSGKKIKRVDPETNETVEEELKELPYIVIVIDELADLMGSHGKEVEGAIVRLAQMARAIGIHLIVSTQRPSVEVITGLIKANITTRIAFQVATQIDSRTILDMGGAEKLLGNGDMLFLSSSSPKPRRIQGVFVGESEVKRVVKFIKSQREKEPDENAEQSITESAQKEITEFRESGGEGSDDTLVEEAKKEIIRSKKASASFLQRRLRIGYARAARLLDILEERGIVGPADGAKPREIYIGNEDANVSYQDNIEDQEKRDKWEI